MASRYYALPLGTLGWALTGRRDAADTPDLDVVSDLVAEVIELVEKLVADLTDEIELDETVVSASPCRTRVLNLPSMS